MKTIIEVRHIVTGEVVRTVDVTGLPQHVIVRRLRIVLANMADENYCATIAEVDNG